MSQAWVEHYPYGFPVPGHMKDKTGRQYMNKKIVSGFAIAAAATLALGAVATAPANAATKTVKLAFLGPLTGAYAGLGQDQIPGAIWALDQYNRTNPKVKVEIDYIKD